MKPRDEADSLYRDPSLQILLFFVCVCRSSTQLIACSPRFAPAGSIWPERVDRIEEKFFPPVFFKQKGEHSLCPRC